MSAKALLFKYRYYLLAAVAVLLVHNLFRVSTLARGNPPSGSGNSGLTLQTRTEPSFTFCVPEGQRHREVIPTNLRHSDALLEGVFARVTGGKTFDVVIVGDLLLSGYAASLGHRVTAVVPTLAQKHALECMAGLNQHDSGGNKLAAEGFAAINVVSAVPWDGVASTVEWRPGRAPHYRPVGATVHGEADADTDGEGLAWEQVPTTTFDAVVSGNALIVVIDMDDGLPFFLRGGAKTFKHSVFAYVIVKFCPGAIRQIGEDPRAVLDAFADLQFNMGVLKHKGDRVQGSDDTFPFADNTLFNAFNFEALITALGKTGSVYLWMSRGWDPPVVPPINLGAQAGLTMEQTLAIIDPEEAEECVLPRNVPDAYVEWPGGPLPVCQRPGDTDVKITVDAKRTVSIVCPTGYDTFKIIEGDPGVYAYDKPFALGDKESLCARCVRRGIRNPTADDVLGKCRLNILRKPILPENENRDEMPPSVVLVLLDATSRAHFRRTQPKTLAKLEALDKDPRWHVVDFEHYNVVGFNSGPNQTPMLSGLPLVGFDPGERPSWIWNVLGKGRGYRTFYSEDLCYQHSLLLKGIGIDEEGPMDHTLLDFFCNPSYRRPHCIENTYVHTYMFDYIEQFMEAYREEPRLAIAKFCEGHEDSMQVLRLVDDPQTYFLERMEAGGFLENTAVFLLSDHGIHYGPYKNTQAGWVEHKNPALYGIFPDSFVRKQPEFLANLRKNAKQLVTAYNLYATFVHLGTGGEAAPDIPFEGAIPHQLSSVFQDIPKRSCVAAGVPDGYCPCTQQL